MSILKKLKLLKLKIKEYGILKIIQYLFEKIIYKKNIFKARKSGGKYTKKIIFQTDADFIFSSSNKENIKKLNKKEIITDAEKILNHEFDLLGSGLMNLGKSIEWNTDFKTGFVWKDEFYKNIQVVDLNNKSDVKVPWELSRFQHLVTLGKAYLLSEDIKYYEEFKYQIIDWIEKNPRYYTVNWTCNMDVSIRAINWIAGYYLFKNLVDADQEFKILLDTSLYGHGEYIYENLEKSCISLGNNHYLSNLNGLIFLGIYFKNLKDYYPKKWLNKGIKELEKEMFVQNNEDGTNYETSTSYHRLITELMFFPLMLLEKNNYEVLTSEYKTRLKKMFRFMAKITKPNGKVPLIGDVDNGRLFIFSEYYDWEVNDFRHLLYLGGEYFNDIYLKSVSKEKNQDKIFLFGENSFENIEIKRESVGFPVGGYYLLQNESIYCLIRCGELSLKGQGGHSHNDQLSFELNICGEDFFIDPGVYTYTADKDMRNLFRSTKMHNTVSIENLEQNSFEENKLFEMKEESFAKCSNFNKSIFIGEHYGFVIKNKSVHKREIKLYDKQIEIIDYLRGDKGIVNLHLDKEVDILSVSSTEIVLEKNNKKIKLCGLKNKYKIERTLISKKYGEIIESKKITIFFKEFNMLKIFL